MTTTKPAGQVLFEKSQGRPWTQHTPGPWALTRSDDQRKDGFIRCNRKLNGATHGLAVGQAFRHGFTYEQYEANANLIAAAPELLEAAKMARDYFISPPFMALHGNMPYDRACAAIAKAEGRE